MPFIVNAECCTRFIRTCYVKLVLFIFGMIMSFRHRRITFKGEIQSTKKCDSLVGK